MSLTLFFRKLMGKHVERSSVRINNFNERTSYIEILDIKSSPRFPLRDISASGLSFFVPENDKNKNNIKVGINTNFKVVINAKETELIVRVVRMDGVIVGCQLVNGEISKYKRHYNSLALAQLQQAM